MHNFNKFLHLAPISFYLILSIATPSYAATKTTYPNIPKMLNAFNEFHKTGKMPHAIMTTYFTPGVIGKINDVVMASGYRDFLQHLLAERKAMQGSIILFNPHDFIYGGNKIGLFYKVKYFIGHKVHLMRILSILTLNAQHTKIKRWNVVH